jgi:hypothetical protein
MKSILAALAVIVVLTLPAQLHAESYDAAEQYACDPATSGIWSYEGYRAEDGSYLDMAYGEAKLPDVTKYAIEAHYIPDGDQPYYPFMVRFPDGLWASPATSGRRFDAVLGWKAPQDANARFTGSVTLKGNLIGKCENRKIKAMLVRGKDELWSAEVECGKTVGFDVSAVVGSGDRVHLHLVNQGDPSGDLALFDMKVDTSPR